MAGTELLGTAFTLHVLEEPLFRHVVEVLRGRRLHVEETVLAREHADHGGVELLGEVLHRELGGEVGHRLVRGDHELRDGRVPRLPGEVQQDELAREQAEVRVRVIQELRDHLEVQGVRSLALRLEARERQLLRRESEKVERLLRKNLILHGMLHRG